MPRGSSKPASMMTYVGRVADDVHRGRLMDAAQSIFALGKKQSVVVAAYVLDQVKGSGNYAAFLRVLESFFDD